MLVRKAAVALLLALPLCAQNVLIPHTDQQKIADALMAGPPYITDGARIVDYPSTPGGEYRELRKGHTGWTCLPTVEATHQRAACFDPTFLKFVQDASAHRPIHIDRVGISYMYEGDWVSPHGAGPTHPYTVGPHIMIVVPNGAGLEGYTTDGSTGKAYINRAPGTSMPYLVIPIHLETSPSQKNSSAH